MILELLGWIWPVAALLSAGHLIGTSDHNSETVGAKLFTFIVFLVLGVIGSEDVPLDFFRTLLATHVPILASIAGYAVFALILIVDVVILCIGHELAD